MSNRELLKHEIDTLPEAVIERLQEFVLFQKFNLGLYQNDDDYLASIPGMVESIQKGMAEQLGESLDSVGWDIS